MLFERIESEGWIPDVHHMHITLPHTYSVGAGSDR